MKHTEKLQQIIEKAWENKEELGFFTVGEIRDAVNTVLNLLDEGSIRIAQNKNNEWQVNEWIKKAILISFKINDNFLIYGPSEVNKISSSWFDKVPSKFHNWQEEDFRRASFRAVPGSIVRKGAYIAKNCVLMPSFVNIGAFVDEGTMVDAWATVGSCAQIGKNCHLSGGVGIGGVLEPLQSNPVIIEDNCFIGARSEIVEGVIVGKGSVISMGVYIGKSTKIIDRETNDVTYGKIPPYSVVVPGSIPDSRSLSLSLYAAVIVKRVDEKTRSKTSINELLRDY